LVLVLDLVFGSSLFLSFFLSSFFFFGSSSHLRWMPSPNTYWVRAPGAKL
jgi:hypothetical protein